MHSLKNPIDNPILKSYQCYMHYIWQYLPNHWFFCHGGFNSVIFSFIFLVSFIFVLFLLYYSFSPFLLVLPLYLCLYPCLCPGPCPLLSTCVFIRSSFSSTCYSTLSFCCYFLLWFVLVSYSCFTFLVCARVIFLLYLSSKSRSQSHIFLFHV